jgi:hypothetical protein
MIVLGGAENDSAAEGQRLWRGGCAGQGLKLSLLLGGQTNEGRTWLRHRAILAKTGTIESWASIDGWDTKIPAQLHSDL